MSDTAVAPRGAAFPPVAGTLYVDGRWSDASGPAIDAFDPTTGRVMASVASASDTDVEAALLAARRAQHAWARTPSVVRGRHLRELADLIHDHTDTFAQLLVQEVGKPHAQAVGEVGFAESLVRYNAEFDRRLEGDILPGDVPGESIHLTREPIGVVAAICPWNYPLGVLCRKVAPALLTGNTVVVKPSEVTPLGALELFRLIDEQLDLPAGVLNLVTGAGQTGAALVRSPLTGLISFTGHRDTGKAIMAQAAPHLTRVSLELGGKAPAIVCADADLDLAVASIVEARHTNSGQVCTCAERVFVQEPLLDEFTQRYVAAVSALSVGHPAGAVDLGPLVSAAQVDKTVAAIDLALEEGAEVLTGGGRPGGDELGDGYWHAPTVLGGLRADMTVMREETFGPVTPIIGVADVQEAVDLANDSRYGLSAYVFSRDYGTVMKTVTDLEFGEIYVNRTLGESVHAHHAGMKESGLGGEDGKWGLLRYTQIKTAYHHHG